MSNLKQTTRFGVALAVALGALAGQAKAVPLPPGGAVATPGTTAAARPELAGVVIADVIRPFSALVGTQRIRGWMQDRVVRESATGTLDFYYRISVDSSSTGAIAQVARASFAPALAPTDVDWRIDGVGLKPPKAAARTATGAIVAFSHFGPNAILPGQQSRFVFIRTRAKQFKLGGASLQWLFTGGGMSIGLPAFQPAY